MGNPSRATFKEHGMVGGMTRGRTERASPPSRGGFYIPFIPIPSWICRKTSHSIPWFLNVSLLIILPIFPMKIAHFFGQTPDDVSSLAEEHIRSAPWRFSYSKSLQHRQRRPRRPLRRCEDGGPAPLGIITWPWNGEQDDSLVVHWRKSCYKSKSA